MTAASAPGALAAGNGALAAGLIDSAHAWRARVLLVLSAGAIGAAVWLAGASVHVAGWERGGISRVAVFAPLARLQWVAAATLAAAGLLVFVRPASLDRRAYRLAPVLLLWLWTVPYVPWLPDYLPLLLVLAGPLKWLVLAAAAAGVLHRVVGPFRLRAATGAAAPRVVFALSLVLYAALGLRSLSVAGLGGDEPHYLIIAHSLWADGDLKIENNHARGDYRPFFGGELRPDYMRRGVDGEIYSIHAPGLPWLLLPAYAVAGAQGAVVLLALLGAAAAWAVFRLAALVADQAAAWFTWAALCLTVPFVPHAWAVFPEIAGAAVVALALWWFAAPRRPGAAEWVVRGMAVAALPWLHTKFVVFVAGLGLMMTVRLWRRRGDLAAFAAPIAVSGLAWLAFFQVFYGTLDPQAPYGDYARQFVRWENVPRSVMGILFDQKFGLIVYAPVYLVAVAGVASLYAARAWRPLAAAVLLLAVPYAVSSARLYMWWGGSSAPARFLVPLAPLCAPLVAAAVVRLRHSAWAGTAFALLAVSLIISAAGIVRASDFFLFSPPHGTARLLDALQGSTPLSSVAPTFTEPALAPHVVRLAWWLAAGAAAAGAGWLGSRLGMRSGLWLTAVQAGTLLLVAAVASRSVDAAVREDAVTRGRTGFLQAYDPGTVRGFDYETFARLSPAQWIERGRLAIGREYLESAGGALTPALPLPEGSYRLRLHFVGARAREGQVKLLLGRSEIATIPGPLANPTDTVVDLPATGLPLTARIEPADAAGTMARVEVLPISVAPVAERLVIPVRAAAPLPGPGGNSFMLHAAGTYPEPGAFWTRGTSTGQVIVVPAGAATLRLTLHVGPTPSDVRLAVDDRAVDLTLAAEETRTLTLPIPGGRRSVAVTIRSSAAFRPADVDPASDDRRSLGCQVRIELE